MGFLFKEFMELSNIIVIFLIVTMLSGLVLYFKTRNFSGTKSEIKLYGIFSGMENIDVIILAFSMIQFIVICYAAIIKQVDIKLYGIIIAFISAIIILYRLRNILLELFSLVAQVLAIYFNQILYQYRIEVEDNFSIKLIQVVLIIFIILYAIYSFLVHIESIVKKNKSVRRNKSSEKK